MAETENLNSPKPPNEEPQTKHTEKEEDKHKTDNEDRGGEKLVYLPDNSLRSLSCIVVPDRSFGTHSETLAFSSLTPSANDHDSDCHSFSELLAGAMASPTKISPEIVNKQSVSMVDLPPALDPARFKGQFGMSHQEALASVTAQAVQAQAQKQLQAGSLEIVPVYLAQPVSSVMSSTWLKQEIPLMSQEHGICTPELVQKDSSNPKMNPANLVKETLSSDGYSWRKYGQKQVKNNESSRSYYKCTDSSCHAKKKVQSCDNSGCVTEIIYKGQHNHEPPQKIRSTKASGSISSACPIVCTDSGRGNGVIECPVEKFNSLAPSISKEEPRHATSEEILLITNESGTDAGVRNEEEQGDEPQPKRRMKNNKVASSAPKIKTIKDHKVVVQAVGDVGISGDGYRWRKYGQKMVKGNPNPRSYYRCTSNGCPVRKHVEKAIDDAAGIIITYEGKHDHDMPVPKKRNGPPSSALLIAPAAAINGEPLKTSEILSDQTGSSQFSTEKEGESTGEKAIELVGEKALESARTLLSIGIELKPC